MEFFIEAKYDKQNIYKEPKYCVFPMSMYKIDYLLAAAPLSLESSFPCSSYVVSLVTLPLL